MRASCQLDTRVLGYMNWLATFFGVYLPIIENEFQLGKVDKTLMKLQKVAPTSCHIRR